MLIDSRAVFHMVDEATHFSAVIFLLKPVHKINMVDDIQVVDPHIFMELSDHLSVDQGSANVS